MHSELHKAEHITLNRFNTTEKKTTQSLFAVSIYLSQVFANMYNVY